MTNKPNPNEEALVHIALTHRVAKAVVSDIPTDQAPHLHADNLIACLLLDDRVDNRLLASPADLAKTLNGAAILLAVMIVGEPNNPHAVELALCLHNIDALSTLVHAIKTINAAKADVALGAKLPVAPEQMLTSLVSARALQALSQSGAFNVMPDLLAQEAFLSEAIDKQIAHSSEVLHRYKLWNELHGVKSQAEKATTEFLRKIFPQGTC